VLNKKRMALTAVGGPKVLHNHALGDKANPPIAPVAIIKGVA